MSQPFYLEGTTEDEASLLCLINLPTIIQLPPDPKVMEESRYRLFKELMENPELRKKFNL